MTEKVEKFIENYDKAYQKLTKDIDEGIERHRKSNLTIRVVDKAENPVDNATIELHQKTHSFDFGINALKLGQFENEEKNKQYEKLITDVFNTVTTTVCFAVYSKGDNDYDFDHGESRRPAINKVKDFAQQNGLRLKGQPLLADSWNPEWANGTDKETLKKYYINWFNAFHNHFGKSFHILDVINESTALWQSRHPDFAFNEDIDSNVKWAFETAKEIFKNDAILEINDAYPYFDDYINRVKTLFDNELIDSAGIQYHFFSKEQMVNHVAGEYYNFEQTYSNMKKMSEIGVPMYISEITLPTNFDDFTQAEAYEIQAEIVKRLYKMWFSIPTMRGIIYWNMDDGRQYNDEGNTRGCLADENLNPKPSYYAIKKLILNEWMTNCSIKTNELGEVSIRGFKGDYEICVKAECGEVKKCIALNEDNTLTVVVE